MFFLSGSGANGKGVFLEVLRHVIGGYAQDASFETFIDSKNKSEHRNDLAALAGARFVTASESQDGHRLDEALIKKLTGGDPVTCRKIYGDPFTYFPQFKIWMHSNYKPVIRGTDWGIWRRVKMIHFDVTIPDDRRDEALAAKLKAEASGVLNWMLRGLADYLKFGSMMYPAKVNEATNEYRESQDVIGRFMKAKCVVGEHCEAKQSDDAQGMTMEQAEISADDLPEGASEAVDAPTADMADDADMGDSESASEPWRPRHRPVRPTAGGTSASSSRAIFWLPAAPPTPTPSRCSTARRAASPLPRPSSSPAGSRCATSRSRPKR